MDTVTGIDINTDTGMDTVTGIDINTTGDFFSYSSTDIHGNTYDFSQLKGKVVLAVNVASY